MGCFHRPAAGWWRHHTGGVCGRAVDYGLCWRQAGDCSKKLHFHPLTGSRLGKTFELTIAATCERDRWSAVPATCTWTCSCVFVQRFSQSPVETVIQCCDRLVPQRSAESRSPPTGMTNLLCLHDGVKFIICNSSLMLCYSATLWSVFTPFSSDSSPSPSL